MCLMQSEKPSCLSHNKIVRVQELVWDDMGSMGYAGSRGHIWIRRVNQRCFIISIVEFHSVYKGRSVISRISRGG